MQLNTKKHDAFCSHIFDYAVEEIRNYRKNIYIKNIFENGWRKDA